MSARVKRILMVGIPNSPHLHRWVGMVARPDTAILIVPSIAIPAELPEGFVYLSRETISPNLAPGIFMVRPEDTLGGPDWQDRLWGYRPLSHHFVPLHLLLRPQRLVSIIRDFRPHLVHAHETQMAGYVTAEALRRVWWRRPPLVLSNWGSDTSLYHKVPRHLDRLNAVLRRVDVYLPDCQRDQAIARRLGYRGPVSPALPSSGGMAMDAHPLPDAILPSQRRLIIVKGYHNWAGRALLALSAVALARDHLVGYRIGIIVASPVVEAAATRLAAETGLDIVVLRYVSDHATAMARLGSARIVIGISMSDGISTTVLEAMSLGAFPIQSATACVDEWYEDGRTGFIVSPHDTRQMADALIRAAHDDALVDAAALVNRETIRSRWDMVANGKRIWEVYARLLPPGPSARA